MLLMNLSMLPSTESCVCTVKVLSCKNVTPVSSRVVLLSESRSPVELTSGQLSSFPVSEVRVILQLRDNPTGKPAESSYVAWTETSKFSLFSTVNEL